MIGEITPVSFANISLAEKAEVDHLSIEYYARMGKTREFYQAQGLNEGRINAVCKNVFFQITMKCECSVRFEIEQPNSPIFQLLLKQKDSREFDEVTLSESVPFKEGEQEIFLFRKHSQGKISWAEKPHCTISLISQTPTTINKTSFEIRPFGHNLSSRCCSKHWKPDQKLSGGKTKTPLEFLGPLGPKKIKKVSKISPRFKELRSEKKVRSKGRESLVSPVSPPQMKSVFNSDSPCLSFPSFGGPLPPLFPFEDLEIHGC